MCSPKQKEKVTEIGEQVKVVEKFLAYSKMELNDGKQLISN